MVNLAHDCRCEEFKMIKVGDIQQLQVHPLHTGLGELSESVDDLIGRAGEGRIGSKLIDISTDRLGPSGDLGVVAASADRECR